MAKRKSDLSKIISYFMGATEPEARAALDSAKTIVADRFDAVAKTARKSGGTRKPKGNGAAAATGDASGS